MPLESAYSAQRGAVALGLNDLEKIFIVTACSHNDLANSARIYFTMKGYRRNISAIACLVWQNCCRR